MKLIEKKLEKFPIYSQEGKGLDSEVVVKFFGGCSCTWLVTEAGQEAPWGYDGHDMLGKRGIK